MSNVVSRSKVREFATWLLTNGGDIKTATNLLQCISAQSPILGKRIGIAVDESLSKWRETRENEEKLTELRKLPFFREVISTPEKGPYVWVD